MSTRFLIVLLIAMTVAAYLASERLKQPVDLDNGCYEMAEGTLCLPPEARK